jgi:2-oxoglutarate ferredoxin oxidoreductase subunit gamma
VDESFRVRLCGRGGQGVMLAGLILAEAGMTDGRHVVQTQSYGPEARLGAAKSDVILSAGEIAFPEVVEPDLLLCLSDQAYARYGAELAENGIRVVDEEVTWEFDVEESIVLPILRTAEQLGGQIAANVVALGVLAGLRDLVSTPSLRAALDKRVKPEFRDLNARALEAGLLLGADLAAQVAG